MPLLLAGGCLILVGGCGVQGTPSSGPSTTPPQTTEAAASGHVERRPGRTYEEERARRQAIEEVEARAVMGRLPSVTLGIPWDEALLLLGIDQAHLLIRGRGARRLAEYARADYVLELVYVPARDGQLVSAVMYQVHEDRSRTVVARARPSVRADAPAPDAHFAAADEVRFTWSVVGDTAVTVRACADPACAEVVYTAADRPPAESGGLGLGPELPPGVYYWSLSAMGIASEARRFFVGATGPDFEPLPTRPSHVLGDPIDAERRIRFVRSDAPWTLRFHQAADDSGAVILVLRRGEEARYMVFEGGHVEDVRARPVHRPNEGQSLLVGESRRTAGGVVRRAHLIEDDGRGPRQVFQAPVYTCAAGDACDPDLRARARIGYRDMDGDGLFDLLQFTAVVDGEEVVARFPRDPEGRYALPPDPDALGGP